LEFRELPTLGAMVGKLIVGEDSAWNNIISHLQNVSVCDFVSREIAFQNFPEAGHGLHSQQRAVTLYRGRFLWRIRLFRQAIVRRALKETSELSVPVVSEGRMYVWPELPDDEVRSVKDNVGQPALTGLRPRAVLHRIISRGDSCRPTRSDNLGCIKALSPAVRPSDDHAA
jgi:hypothetical protein